MSIFFTTSLRAEWNRFSAFGNFKFLQTKNCWKKTQIKPKFRHGHRSVQFYWIEKTLHISLQFSITINKHFGFFITDHFHLKRGPFFPQICKIFNKFSNMIHSNEQILTSDYGISSIERKNMTFTNFHVRYTSNAAPGSLNHTLCWLFDVKQFVLLPLLQQRIISS